MTTPRSERICRYNVTCDNSACVMYKKVIGQTGYSDYWLNKNKRKKEKEMLKRNKGRRTRKKI